jgi:ribokinase
VIVVGSVNADRVIRCRSLPAAGETVVAHGRTDGFGGKGGNQAAAAAQLGAETWLIAAVGDDAAGRDAAEDLAQYGVHVDLMRTVHGVTTGEAVVVVEDDGENLIVVVPGANAVLSAGDVAADLASLGLAVDDVVLISAEIAEDCVRAVIMACSAAGARVVYNLAPARPLADWACAPHVVLVVNELESIQVSGAGTAALALIALAERVGAVVVTRGKRGARMTQGRVGLELSAPRVDVVDTTGAGDAFCGALAADLAAERRLTDAVATATAAGSIAVTGAGARGSLATRAGLRHSPIPNRTDFGSL